MTFQQLRAEALATIRRHIANGYFTERQLARVARVSQPQVHNVLKGARLPSAATLDRICQAAHIDVAEIAAAHRKPATINQQQPWWKIAA